MRRRIGGSIEAGGQVYARGRAPYSPPWPDVVRLNAVSDEPWTVAVDTPGPIGDQADGVRCDTAMLLMDGVFGRTWGGMAAPAPRATCSPGGFSRNAARGGRLVLPPAHLSSSRAASCALVVMSRMGKIR
ncbi:MULTISPECIES: hypothetical protein [unclassified Streptomyces]|uniref:hypothetical protein n=1 Tax=unclassified Streptomyces TaxID=2593676 RepID=UPI003711CA35